MAKLVGALVVSILLLSGCGPEKLSPTEQQQLDALKQALSSTEKDISRARNEKHKYSDQPINQLISARLEILKENSGYLQRSIDAMEASVRKGDAQPLITTDEHTANLLSEMIGSLQKEIMSSRHDVAQESAGPALTIKLSAIAWQEQVLARMQQRYLTARFTIKQEAGLEPEHQQNTTEKLFPPADGPFGFLPGLSKNNIEQMTGAMLIPVQGKPDLYRVAASPKSSDEFGNFLLRISPQAGLCQINAISKDITTDEYGISLKGKFNEISNMLSATYGKAQKIDVLKSGSAWQEVQEWMMGLYSRERELRMKWHTPNNPMNQKQLQSVDLKALANNPETGYIMLQYTFKNNSACAAEIKM